MAEGVSEKRGGRVGVIKKVIIALPVQIPFQGEELPWLYFFLFSRISLV